MTRSYTIRALSMTALFAVAALTPAIVSAEAEKTDGFVCPVIKTENVTNSPKGAAIGEGHYTIVGPDVEVPTHATNGDGSGTPAGPHAQPGDTDYTAVWAQQ